MSKNMILYRGSLKGCNYKCSYCPFSKRASSRWELKKDQKQWQRFCQSLYEKAPLMNIHALQVVPYGEALLHPWYWEEFGKLTAWKGMEAVGAQTNLSFPMTMLDTFQKAGGKIKKLRLWASFHPEMTSVSEFAEKCEKIREEGIALCAGVVGVPEHLEQVQQLREALSEDIYLWVNQMEGLKRAYTPEEEAAFSEIDPFFMRETLPIFSEHADCSNRIFVEADGKIHTCSMSQQQKQNWYALERDAGSKKPQIAFPTPECNRRVCSGYLAYGGQVDFMNQVIFGPYALFRIPRRAKAVFLDIDGTLFPKGEKEIPERTMLELKALLKDGNPRLFFATSLSYGEARKRCGEIWSMFQGGIFAGGAHLLWKEQNRREEWVYPLYIEMDGLSFLKMQKEKFHFRILTYRHRGTIYKLTLSRPKSMPWKQKEAEDLLCSLSQNHRGNLRCLIERNRMEIISQSASKAEGVKQMCKWMGISLLEAAAAGDGTEDQTMMKLCNGEKRG